MAVNVYGPRANVPTGLERVTNATTDPSLMVEVLLIVLIGVAMKATSKV
jgi:hypothetical protein